MRNATIASSYGALIGLQRYRDGWVWHGLLVLALASLPLVAGNYLISYATLVLVGVVGAVGLNLLTGTTGLISLGYAGFLAIGGYTTAILVTDYGWPLLAAIPASGVVSAALSLLVGIPSLRLKGLYLAMTTLAFSIIVTHVILIMEPITHGSGGMQVLRPSLMGIPMRSSTSIYYLCLGIAVLSTLFVANLMRSRFGRALSAIRDYDTAALLMGINLVRYKLAAFAVSSFLIGIAGSMFALHLRYINVDTYHLTVSIEALAMIIVGGLGSIRGAILGALFITLLPEASRIVFTAIGGPLQAILSTSAMEIRNVLYGLAIVFFLRFEPDGLNRRWLDIKRYWSEWPLSRSR